MKAAFVAAFALALLAACGKKPDPAPQRPPDDAPMPGDCRTEADCEAVVDRECGVCCPRVVAKKKSAPKEVGDCAPTPSSCDAAACGAPPKLEDYALTCARGACFANRKVR